MNEFLQLTMIIYKHKSGTQKQQVCEKEDQRSVNGLQSFLKCAKFYHGPGQQSMDSSVSCTSEPSWAGEDVDLGVSVCWVPESLIPE